MYYGVVESESLENPLILNSFNPIKIRIEHHPQSITSVYWHVYLLSVSDQSIREEAEKFATQMKYGWYAVFWNEEKAHIVFTNKIFILTKEDDWQSKEYLKVKEYGINHGIQAEYMDFNKNFKAYNKLVRS